MGSEAPTPYLAAPSKPPVGHFVAVDGRRLFAHRAGNGRPTIVFLPGAGAVGLDYFNVFAEAAESSTALLYDRAGTGWSDPIPLPRTPTEVVDELRRFLSAAGLEPPFLLVGHSLGGGYAQQYARRFPGEVAALLLLDPAHEDYPRYIPAPATPEGAETIDLATWELPPAVIEHFTSLFREKFASWPDGVREAVIDQHATRWRAGLLEASNLTAIYEDLARPAPLGDIPTIVLTALALDPGSQLFMPDEWQRQVIDGKRRLNTALAASIPRGEQRLLPDASHAWMQAERPDAVVQALRDLLAIVRSGWA